MNDHAGWCAEHIECSCEPAGTVVTIINETSMFPDSITAVTRDSRNQPIEAQRYYRHDTIMGDLKKVLARLDNA